MIVNMAMGTMINALVKSMIDYYVMYRYIYIYIYVTMKQLGIICSDIGHR